MNILPFSLLKCMKRLFMNFLKDRRLVLLIDPQEERGACGGPGLGGEGGLKFFHFEQ